MIFDDAIIHITHLRLRTYIGFNPEELEKKQDVVIDVRIHYPAAQACSSDDENEALDYKVITKAIIEHVESGRFKLLEKLTADVLEIAMRPTQVSRAEVTIEKPHALRFSDSVSVTLSASRAGDDP
ncbi:MAG: dihydroneopterin triphosphate 2'-epimerase [Oleiphilaceae bacterium]|nr:dihydroneopterin triphosphate 2'-epimerase [Oleiphilaceae bacterium]